MSDSALIDGNYADFKLVKTRSVCQLIIEIPIEKAEAAISAFGMPIPGSEIRVVVARLVDPSPELMPPSPDASERGRAAYAGKSPGEQAVVRSALLAREPAFQSWFSVHSETDAAAAIRQRCKVHSRKELATNNDAFQRFMKMESDYHFDMSRGNG
jgi:hypothetical protein